MKKASFLVLLIAGVLLLGSAHAASIRPAFLGGAYDELLPDAVKGKLFVPSIDLRWEYDDNIYTTTKAEKADFGVSEEESWKLYVEPKIDIHWLSATTYFGLSYQYSFIWYDNRPEDDTDMAHDALVDFRHHFSPSVEVVVRDLFRSSEEPEIAEDIVTAGGIRIIPLQRNGGFDYNQATVGLNLQTGRRLWWNWSYTNLYVNFDEPESVLDMTGTLRRGASYYYDRMAHSGAVKAQYLATPQCKVNAGVRFTDTDYDSDALLKDNQSWIAFVGVDHNLAKKCVGSVLVGWENRDYNDIDLTQDSPFVDLSLRSGFGKKSNATVGYRFALDETDQASYAFEELHTLYAGINAWLAAWTSLHVNTSYEMGSFDSGDIVAGRASGNRDQDVWLLGLVLRQHVNKDIYIEAGYRRTDVDSDFAGADYDRNRYFLGVGGIF
jgi:hypothetical protein